MTSQVRAAFAYFAPCIARVRGVTHSGMMQRDEVVDHRRAHPPALGRVHPVGEVEYVDRAEQALGGGRPRRLHAVRTACENGSAPERLDRQPVERRADRAPARFRLVGANATISCSPPVASASPASEPRM